MGTSRITTKSIAAESSNLCASFCWQPTLITASKLLSKFPDCTLQVLNLFVGQYPPRCAALTLFNSEWNNGFTTNWSWKHTKSHVASCDITMKATTSCYFFCCYSIFSVKRLHVKNRSKILTTNCYLDFFFGSHCLTKLDCYDLLPHNVTRDYKIIGSRVFLMSPKA